MRRLLEFMATVAGCMPLCHGQSMLDMVNFKSAQVGGVRLYNVSAFGGYSTSAALPGSVTGVGANLLGPDFNYGSGVAAGWQHHGARTNTAFMYSGTYMGMARYTELNSYNQGASISISRALSQKWTMALSGGANDITLAQFLFQPSNLSVVSNLSASFDDLAAAFSVGQFSNSQMATMLTGSPILDAPTRTLLLGNRILSASAQASLTYAHSSRLRLQFSSSATGAQNFKGIETGLLPASKGVGGQIGISYSLSPRTEIGAVAEVSRIHNALQRASTYNTMASWGRKMGPRWFLRLSGGGSHTQSDTPTYSSPPLIQVIGSGSIGFQTLRHTFVASASRSATDPFGIAAANIMIANGTWSWRPVRSLTMFSGIVHQRWISAVYRDLSAWQASAGISKPLGSGLSLSAEYSYMYGTSLYLGTLGNRSIQGARVSISWSPGPGGR